jgi:hypothetical protein
MIDRIIDWLIANFEAYLNPLWDSTFFWRSLSLILLSLVALVFVNRGRIVEIYARQVRKEHDREIFRKSNEILNENQLEDFLENLSWDHSFYSDDLNALNNFRTFFSGQGNQYIDRKLQRASLLLAKTLKEMNDFLRVSFFYYPENQDSNNKQFCMYPHLNVDRIGTGVPFERKKYNEASRKLTKLMFRTKLRYNQYRRLIKQRLYL